MSLNYCALAFIAFFTHSLKAMEQAEYSPEKMAQMLFRSMCIATSLDGYDLQSIRGIRDLLDNTLLIKAAARGNERAVADLLKAESSINAYNSAGQTALIIAVKNKHAKIAEILCDKGADVNAQDFFGRTALIEAITNNDVPLVRLLLIHGANRELPTGARQTAREIAIRLGFTEVLETLDTPAWHFLIGDFFNPDEEGLEGFDVYVQDPVELFSNMLMD